MEKSTNDLKLYLFGYPRISMDGRPVRIQRKKVFALLAYIGLQDRSVSREQLAALFWPDCERSHAHANLRKILSCIGAELGKDILRADLETAGPLNSGKLWIDAVEFENGSRVKSGYPDRKSDLREKIALYTDDFLAGFSIAECDQFTEWQFLNTEYFKQELCTYLEQLALICQQDGDFILGIKSARRLVEIDILNEEAHRLLMRLFLGSGQIEAALRQYRLCAKVLEGELGEEPDEKTNSLFQKIRGLALTETRTLSGQELPEDSSPAPPEEKNVTDEISRILTTITAGDETGGDKVAGDDTASRAESLCMLGDFTLRFSQYRDGNVRRARRYYGQAILTDPSCAEAYAGLAFSFFSIGGYGVDARPFERRKVRIDALARKALSLNPGCAKARMVLAGKKMEWEFDFPRAEVMFREALAENPDHADTLVWFSELLLGTGRFEEAFPLLQRAHEINPLDIATNCRMALYYLKAGSYDESLRFARLVDSLYPGRYLLRGLQCLVYLFTRQYEKALEIARQCVDMQKNCFVMCRLIITNACCGRHEEAREAMNYYTEEFSKAVKDDTYYFFAALANHFLGDDEKAITFLELSAATGDISLVHLAIDPFWGALHWDPRFQAVVKKLSLPLCLDYIEEVLRRTKLPASFK